MDERFVATPVGRARLDWYAAEGAKRATVVLGHGTATGGAAADLQALARALLAVGIEVVLVTQPYRVEGNYDVADEPSLDGAWTAIWPAVSDGGVPVVSGGRSAGSQVACRTARALDARAVVVLAYPLLGPGSPGELLATGKPTLVVQGGADPFGRPSQFPKLPRRSSSSRSATRITCSPPEHRTNALRHSSISLTRCSNGWSAGCPDGEGAPGGLRLLAHPAIAGIDVGP
jgi:predicted alpha/beta-hydrolase family hydrolase